MCLHRLMPASQGLCEDTDCSIGWLAEEQLVVVVENLISFSKRRNSCDGDLKAVTGIFQGFPSSEVFFTHCVLGDWGCNHLFKLFSCSLFQNLRDSECLIMDFQEHCPYGTFINWV